MPCLPGIRRVPSTPRSSSRRQRRVRRSGLDRADQAVQRDRDLAQLAEHGGGVGADDLLPQPRVAAGDPGDVAQALAGEHEVLVGDVREVAGHQHRDQVRQVGHPGYRGVVVVDVEHHQPGSAGADELDHPLGRLLRALAVRRDDPGPVHEQLAVSGHGAGVVRTGHRVRAHVAGQVEGSFPQGVEHAGLDRADVGDGGVRVRPEALPHHIRDRARRDGDDDEADLDRVGGCRGAGPQPGRDDGVAGDGVDEVDGPTGAGQRVADRGPDQAGPDHDGHRRAGRCTHGWVGGSGSSTSGAAGDVVEALAGAGSPGADEAPSDTRAPSR